MFGDISLVGKAGQGSNLFITDLQAMADFLKNFDINT